MPNERGALSVLCIFSLKLESKTYNLVYVTLFLGNCNLFNSIWTFWIWSHHDFSVYCLKLCNFYNNCPNKMFVLSMFQVLAGGDPGIV